MTDLRPSASKPNPFAPPATGDVRSQIENVTIAPIRFPSESPDCEFFTYEEFAALFEEKLANACRLLSIPNEKSQTHKPDENHSTAQGLSRPKALFCLSTYGG